MKKGELNAKGFTIIEVTLVLAIAGLIFLMVFVALPALQRQQRDTRRRENVMSLITQVKKFQSNNRGALPSMLQASGDTATSGGGNTPSGVAWQDFYTDYLKQTFVDPDGTDYTLRIEPCGNGVTVDADCTADVLSGLPDSRFPFTYNNNKYTMIVLTQATCYGDKAVGAANPRKIAVLYKLEGAGVYCDNS